MDTEEQKIIFRRRIHSYTNDPEEEMQIRTGGSLILLIIWLLSVYFFEVDILNFYFISAFSGIQIIHWLYSKEETLIITKTDFTYQFLIYKKTRRIQSYQKILIRYMENPYSDKKSKYEFCECILLQTDKFEFKIVENAWKKNYKDIKAFLEKNYSQNKLVKRPRILFKHHREMSLFFLLALIFTSILSIGVFLENPENIAKEVVYYEGTLSKDASYSRGLINYIFKDSGDLVLRINEFPKTRFSLDELILNEIKETNTLPLLETGDTIGLYMDKKDYEIKLIRNRNYPYFTSHLVSNKRVNLYGLKYDGYELNDPRKQQGQSRNENMYVLLPLIFVFAFGINIFSNKIKILD